MMSIELSKLIHEKEDSSKGVLIVRVSTEQYMMGGSWCTTTKVTPLKRKSTLDISDIIIDPKEDKIIGLHEASDGVYSIETIASYDEFNNVDDFEIYLKRFTEG